MSARPAIHPVLLRDLFRSRRRLVVGLLAGLAAFVLLYLAIFPSLQEQMAAFSADLPDAMRAFIGEADIATPEGYIRSQAFSLSAPLLVSALAIAAGVAMTKSERDRTLTSVYFAPVSRTTVALTHAALVVLVSLAGGVVVALAVVVGGPLADAQVGLAHLAGACLHLAALATAMGAVAFGAANWTGSPATGNAAGWGLVAASFLANSIASLVDDLAWLGDAQPWGWYGSGAPIDTGVVWGDLGLLFGLAVLGIAAGVRGYVRRDLQL